MANKLFSTDFRVKISVNTVYDTHLEVVMRSLNLYDTDFRLKANVQNVFNTDLRLFPDVSGMSSYDTVTPKALNNFIVYKDGVELVDVDYNTLHITFNLNGTASVATFVVARYHDKINYTIDNVESVITEENKIQIYDGTILLFTGYIQQIQANSDEETVTITAEDVRCKIRNRSMKLSYGGKAVTEDNAMIVDVIDDLPTDIVEGLACIVKHNNHLYIYLNSVWSDRGDLDTLNWSNQIISISTKTALEQVFSEINDLISDYDSIYFGFIPEYVEEYNDCVSLIDMLIQNSANVNWYIDENEKIRFQKVADGEIKSLSLSSLNEQRHLYDVVVNSVTLNKKTSEFVTAYEVKFGNYAYKVWTRSSEHPNLDELPENYVRELTWFGFQHSSTSSLYGLSFIYVGENITSIPGYENAYFWIRGYFIYQWLSIDENRVIPPVLIGSGFPRKTVYYTSYGKQQSPVKWEERALEDGKSYLYKIREPQIDNTAYALDVANFDLSQNNVEKTDAQITLILDAYEFYGITLKDRINITNTLTANIYNGQNGFPLNVQSISIDCSTRLVTLSLTNYGKTYRQRSGNIMLNYLAKSEIKSYLKYLPIEIGS